MPIYTYLCKKCGNKFDLLIGVNAEKTKLECPKCKSKSIDKLMGTFSVGDSSSSKLSSSGPSCSTGTCPTCFG